MPFRWRFFLKSRCPGTLDIAGLIPDASELERQRGVIPERMPLVSILCPVYNTNVEHLKTLLESVLAQTYAGIELCICNASDKTHPEVAGTIERYAASDSRIRFAACVNRGIARNTNECAAMARGEYLVLIDHDDIVPPHAVHKFVQSLNRHPEADFFYSDEAVFFVDACRGCHPVRKADFSFEHLRQSNYICHLVMLSRALFEKAGRFREEFNGSQDYDLFLRACELAGGIVHIPDILYFWRIHPQSFSQRKIDDCIASGKRALEEHLRRSGIAAEVLPQRRSPIYRIVRKDVSS